LAEAAPPEGKQVLLAIAVQYDTLAEQMAALRTALEVALDWIRKLK